MDKTKILKIKQKSTYFLILEQILSFKGHSRIKFGSIQILKWNLFKILHNGFSHLIYGLLTIYKNLLSLRQGPIFNIPVSNYNREITRLIIPQNL